MVRQEISKGESGNIQGRGKQEKRHRNVNVLAWPALGSRPGRLD